MLIWFPHGWEQFAKWSDFEEAEVAGLILKKRNIVERMVRQVKRDKRAYRKVDLGYGPGNRRYHIAVDHVGHRVENHDLLQMMGAAPINGTRIEIFAVPLPNEFPDGQQQRILIGRVYEDGDRGSIRIIGIEENRRMDEIIRNL